jgi:DNA mismatch repair protein MutL
MKLSKREKLVRALAKQGAIKQGAILSGNEMMQLLSDLFACAQPNVTADGRPVFIEFSEMTLEKMFN